MNSRRPVLILLPLLLAAATPVPAQNAGPDQLRRLLDGLKGATPVQCELALRSFGSWWGWEQAIPDRDPAAAQLVNWVERGRTDAALVPLLAAALREPDLCVRRMAVRLLGRIRVPAARARLVEALGDTDPQIRQLGAVGLGFSNDKTAIPQLVRALQDRDPRVRSAAAWAIGAVH